MRHILSKVLLVIFIVILVTGCATMQSRWESTKHADNIQAYEKFLNQYPESKFNEEAKSKIENLRFEEMKKKDQIAYYEKFMEDFPKSKNSQYAKSGLENKIVFLQSLRTKKIRIEQEQNNDIDLLFPLFVEELLEEMGYDVASINDTDFDATLKIDPIMRGLPAGTYRFKSNLKKARPYYYAYFVKFTLYHHIAGAIFEENIWGDFVPANTPGERIFDMLISLNERITFGSGIESDTSKRDGRWSLRRNSEVKLREYFKKYFGGND